MSADAWDDVATCSGCGRAAQTDPCADCEVDYGDDVLGPAPSKAAGEPIDGSASVFEALDGAATRTTCSMFSQHATAELEARAATDSRPSRHA